MFLDLVLLHKPIKEHLAIIRSCSPGRNQDGAYAVGPVGLRVPGCLGFHQGRLENHF